MELILVRHGVAHERDARRWADDEQRPLTAAGAERARRAAAGLVRIAPRPARVLSSPAVRALETAAILTRVARWPQARPCPALHPDAPVAALLALLGRSGGGPVAVVGHQPGLGELLAACLRGRAAGDAFDLRKMGAALITFPARAAARRGELHWLMHPKALRALRPRAPGR